MQISCVTLYCVLILFEKDCPQINDGSLTYVGYLIVALLLGKDWLALPIASTGSRVPPPSSLPMWCYKAAVHPGSGRLITDRGRRGAVVALPPW